MPVKTGKSGTKYVVRDASGRVYGKHTTKKGADSQASAINIKVYGSRKWPKGWGK